MNDAANDTEHGPVNEAGPVGPLPGAPVRVLPKSAGREVLGSLLAWSQGPAGIIATADIELSDDDAESVAGHPVWATISADAGDGSGAASHDASVITVLEGIATPLPGGEAISLTGALSLASETRRQAARASTTLPIEVGDERAATIDLSRTGARISLPVASLPASVRIALDLGLGEDEVITTRAEVVRVDEARGEIAVKFSNLSVEQAVRIDRAVLAALSQSQ